MLAADEAAGSRIESVIAGVSKDMERGAQPLVPGSRIGNYVVVREIGHGGMGVVYHAIRADGEFHQAVAIKVIGHGLHSAAAQHRFRQERHILARLDHPSIARMFDGGTTPEGHPYLVMELIDGIPITRYCARNLLDRGAILKLFLEVCEGVGHAHQRQVVHRDLKPGNILVTPEGRPKLLDFGIAKWLDPQLSPETVVLTAPGFAALTPDYASPEQHRSEAVTARADIYSLGAILFELITGQRAVACGPSTRAALVGDLAPVIEKAMALKAEDRYSSVDAMTGELRSLMQPPAPPAPAVEQVPVQAPVSRPSRRRWLWGAASAAVVPLGAAAWWWILGRAHGEVDSIAVLPFMNLGTEPDEERIADGLTEDIITELALIPSIKVPSRTASWQYRGKAMDPREAGRAMGVSAVLEGSVRRSGDRVRVVAQLISVRDGFHLWAQNYDRVETDPLAVQTQVSRLIANDLRQRLLGEAAWNETGRAEPAGAAQQAYLEGYQLFQMDAILAEWGEEERAGLPPRMEATIRAFERATELDPRFAAAWAGLAEVCEWAATLHASMRRELCGRAEAAARRALDLEPTNAIATATLGLLALTHDWRPGRAEPFLRQAIALRPRTTGLYTDYADCLLVLNRDQEAIECLERVRLLEPGSARPAARLAVLMAQRGENGRARSYGEAALAIEPRNRHALWALAFTEEREGRVQEAETAYRQILRIHLTEDRTLASLGSLLARHDKRGEAILIAGRLREMIRRDRRREVFEALVRTGLGDRRTALTLLEQAWEHKDPNLLFLHLESRFAPLAGEPRFQRIQEQLRDLR